MQKEGRFWKVVKWGVFLWGAFHLIWMLLGIGYLTQTEDRLGAALVVLNAFGGLGLFVFLQHIRWRGEGDYYEWVLEQAGKTLVADSLEPNLYDILTQYAKWRLDERFDRLTKSVVAIVSSYLNSGGTLFDPTLVEVVSYVAGRVSENQGKSLYVSLNTERSNRDRRTVLITLAGGVEPYEIRGKIEVV